MHLWIPVFIVISVFFQLCYDYGIHLLEIAVKQISFRGEKSWLYKRYYLLKTQILYTKLRIVCAIILNLGFETTRFLN